MSHRVVWLGLSAALVVGWSAGAVVDEVLAAVTRTAWVPGCSSVVACDPPDNGDGAYVFRNGLAEAVDRQGLNVRVITGGEMPSPGSCSVTWTPPREGRPARADRFAGQGRPTERRRREEKSTSSR